MQTATMPIASSGGAGVGIVVLLIAVGAYFIPTMVAAARSKENTGGIFLVNLLTGWTFIGWIAALVMACSGPGGGPKMVFCSACHFQMAPGLAECPSCGVRLAGQNITDRKCPHCAETIKAEAKVCRYCQRELEPVG